MLKTEEELLQIAIGLWIFYWLNMSVQFLAEIASGLWLFYSINTWISNRHSRKFSERLKNKPVVEIVDPIAEAAERKQICRAIGMPEPTDLSDLPPLAQPDRHS